MYALASICTFRFMLGLHLCQVYLNLLSNSESQQNTDDPVRLCVPNLNIAVRAERSFLDMP